MGPLVVWIAWGIAVASTAACVTLWFREVRRVLGSLRSTVESAAAHLAACRNRAAQLNDAEAADVLERSESICHQAEAHYNEAMEKPWFYLPGRLMGFRPLDGGEGKRCA